MGKPGRPRAYTDEAAEEICRRIAQGESLRTVCADDHLPAISTVSLWVVNDEGGFSERYTRARRAQAVLMADELMGIADDGINDTYKDEDGYERTNHDVIARSRLRVDTRKWYLSKVLPKVYGEKLELSGPNDGPIEISITRRVVKPGEE